MDRKKVVIDIVLVESKFNGSKEVGNKG